MGVGKGTCNERQQPVDQATLPNSVFGPMLIWRFGLLLQDVPTGRKTKVVCTLGPACWSEEGLAALLDAGMNVARFNFSHGSHASHQEVLDRLKKVRGWHEGAAWQRADRGLQQAPAVSPSVSPHAADVSACGRTCVRRRPFLGGCCPGPSCSCPPCQA